MNKCLLFSCFLGILFITGCEKNPVDPDGFSWPASSPGRQKMDAEYLEAAMNEARLIGSIDALLVIRNGKLVSEGYFNEYEENTPHAIMSVSKSFLSAISGLAVDQGYFTTDDKIIDYFPEYRDLQADPRINDVTIMHLLTMRMGINDEADENYGVYQDLYNSSDWVKATLQSEMIDDPGERMHYNTFQTHLLSVIITKATKQSTLEYATEALFEPMGIDVDSWEQDPQGYFFGGNSMFFTPREMAVLGLLYLNNGKIYDTQIIPESWIDLTLSASTNLNHPNEWGAWKDYNYAYLWWLGKINDFDMFMAYGYGGQFVVVFPALELIVVATSASQVNPETSTIQEWAIFDIISNYILPSVND